MTMIAITALTVTKRCGGRMVTWVHDTVTENGDYRQAAVQWIIWTIDLRAMWSNRGRTHGLHGHAAIYGSDEPRFPA